MNDLIYRNQAIEAISKLPVKVDNLGYTWMIAGDVLKQINDISSVESERKGKWIKIPEFCGDDISGFVDNHFSCSECKKEAEINSWGFYILSDFCPNCGANMKGE